MTDDVDKSWARRVAGEPMFLGERLRIVAPNRSSLTLVFNADGKLVLISEDFADFAFGGRDFS